MLQERVSTQTNLIQQKPHKITTEYKNRLEIIKEDGNNIKVDLNFSATPEFFIGR